MKRDGTSLTGNIDLLKKFLSSDNIFILKKNFIPPTMQNFQTNGFSNFQKGNGNISSVNSNYQNGSQHFVSDKNGNLLQINSNQQHNSGFINQQNSTFSIGKKPVSTIIIDNNENPSSSTSIFVSQQSSVTIPCEENEKILEEKIENLKRLEKNYINRIAGLELELAKTPSLEVSKTLHFWDGKLMETQQKIQNEQDKLNQQRKSKDQNNNNSNVFSESGTPM